MSEKVTLFDLTESFNNVKDMIDDETFEDNAELKTALNKIEDDIKVKADNIAKIIADCDMYIAGFKKQEENFKKKRTAIENKIKFLKQYLQESMEQINCQKLKTELFSFNIQNNLPRLYWQGIEDGNIPDNLPEEYIKTIKNIDKAKLKADIKAGADIEGISLISDKSLRIR